MFVHILSESMGSYLARALALVAQFLSYLSCPQPTFAQKILEDFQFLIVFIVNELRNYSTID